MRRYLIFLLFVAGISGISAQTVIRIDRGSSGLEFEGIGAVGDAGLGKYDGLAGAGSCVCGGAGRSVCCFCAVWEKEKEEISEKCGDTIEKKMIL